MSECVPHLFVQSTLKYFQSKKVKLDVKSVRLEEDRRVTESHLRTICLRRPSTMSNGDINFIRRRFPNHRGQIWGTDFVLKLIFNSKTERDKDYDYDDFNKKMLQWRNGEKVEIVTNLGNRKYFSRLNVVTTHLVLLDFPFQDFEKQKVKHEIGTLFPKYKTFSEQENLLHIEFSTEFDAFEAFQRGQDVMICGLRPTIIYKRLFVPFFPTALAKEDWILHMELERTKREDTRIIFLEYPSLESGKFIIKTPEIYAANVIYDSAFHWATTNFIKFVFTSPEAKEASRAKRSGGFWPLGQRFKFTLPNYEHYERWLKCREILGETLVVRNIGFCCQAGEEHLEDDLSRVFPKMINFFVASRGNFIKVFFDSKDDAFEAFALNDKFKLCHWECTVTFERDKFIDYNHNISSREFSRDRSRSRSRSRSSRSSRWYTYYEFKP